MIGLSALVGCSNTPQRATEPTASSTAPTTDTAKITSVEGFNSLRNVVTNTKAAVEAGDFAKAKTEFSQFEDSWSQVEDGVKDKSADTYDAIESSVDQINNELKASQPDQNKVLAGLQSLTTDINSVAQ